MAELQEIHAPVPTTERGRGILVSGNAATSWMIYCNGRSVIMRSLVDPLKVEVYREHAAPVTVARFSPTGDWVASGDASGTVRVWSAVGPEYPLKFESKALSGRIDDLDWSPDGQRIVVCGDAKGKSFVRAFMWDSGNNVGEFDGHSKRVLSCTFRPTRPFRIATCGEDFLLNFYEGPPFRFKTSHRHHSNFVNCVRYSPDGSKFITVGSDKKGFLFNGQTGEKIGELLRENGHSGSIYAAIWSPDAKQILTVSADKTAKIWDIIEDGNGKVKTTFDLAGNAGADDMQVGCLWLKEHLISISLGGVISFLSPADPGSPLKYLSGHMKSITSFAVSKFDDQTEIYSSSYDGLIIRWIVGAGYANRLKRKDSVPLKNIAVVGDELFACGLDTKLWRMPLPRDQNGAAECIDLKASPIDVDAAFGVPELVLGAMESGIVLLKGSVVISTTNMSYTVTAAALSPDGTEAIVGSKDGKLYVYSVRGDMLTDEAVLEKHRGAITAVQFSPDGSMFASGDANREAFVWDRITREIKLKNMLYHTARISCLTWSPDNLKVATGSLDTSILVYDVTKPASSRITVRGAHLGGVNGLGFKDASTLVSAGDDACIPIWKLPSS